MDEKEINLEDTQATLNDEVRAQELEKGVTSDDEAQTRSSKAVKILKIIISILLYTTVIVLIVNFCGADHKELDNLYITDNFMNSYLQSVELRTHSAGTEMSQNGAIYAFSYVYNEQTGYMQLTVRYNTRHLKEVLEAINKPETDIVYTLDDIGVFYTISDADGNIYEPTVLDTASWRNYVYYKLELKNVNFDTDSLSVNMMLKNVKQTEIDGKQTLVFSKGDSTNAGSVLTFHEKDDTYIEYKLSRKEKKEMEEKSR